MTEGKYNPRYENINLKIADAGMQIYQFQLFQEGDIEAIRKVILRANLKTLEEVTGKTCEELEKCKHGICDAYNKMINELKNPNLTKEKYLEILKNAMEVVKT